MQCNVSFKLLGAGADVASVGAKVRRVKMFAVSDGCGPLMSTCGSGTVPVDGFAENPWGFYNVHGNVWDWTEDRWNPSNSGNPGDGNARIVGDCNYRVRQIRYTPFDPPIA
jgi:Sulfatase-modifying factor enzyme 1